MSGPFLNELQFRLLLSQFVFLTDTQSPDVSHFDKDKIAAGKTVIGLQSGSNTGASQKGMGFGMPRNTTKGNARSKHNTARCAFPLETVCGLLKLAYLPGQIKIHRKESFGQRQAGASLEYKSTWEGWPKAE